GIFGIELHRSAVPVRAVINGVAVGRETRSIDKAALESLRMKDGHGGICGVAGVEPSGNGAQYQRNRYCNRRKQPFVLRFRSGGWGWGGCRCAAGYSFKTKGKIACGLKALQRFFFQAAADETLKRRWKRLTAGEFGRIFIQDGGHGFPGSVF